MARKYLRNTFQEGSRIREGQKYSLGVGPKVGATAGWAVAAASNVGRMATCPASQTASTLVVQLAGLRVGNIITGFHGVGQIESAGGTVTLDIELRKLTAAAADLTDATVQGITQLSVTADTIISATNARRVLTTPQTVAANERYYLLLTATTAAATDIDLMDVLVEVDEQ